MFSLEISEVAKTSFRAFNFKDGSVYYGETAYLDEEGNVVLDLAKIDDTKIKQLKLIRHGFGVQLFGVEDTNYLCKYEGQWEKDNRTGKGICFFSDKSSYEGGLEKGIFNGFGKFTWNNSNVYIGEWKNGKLDGEGEFKHYDGHILKGTFRNNYYMEENVDKQGFIFLNPFMEISSLDVNRNHTLVTSSQKKINRSLLEEDFLCGIKLNEFSSLSSLINKIIVEKDKTPFFIKDANVTKREVIGFIESSLQTKVIEIDFRSIHSSIESSEYKKEELQKLEEKVAYCIFNGCCLFLNYDDNSEYQKLFDPPLSHYFKKLQFSPYMFTPSKFKVPEIFKHFSKQDHLRREKPLNPEFKFVVYSKCNIGKSDVINKQNKDLLITLFDNRLGKQFDLNRLNVVIVHKGVDNSNSGEVLNTITN